MLRVRQGVRTGLGHGASPVSYRHNFLVYIENDIVYCVYSLESARRGDSSENTQHSFMLKKIRKVSLLCLLTWHCD